MKAKLAFKAVLAFCLALAIGWLVLPSLYSEPRREAIAPRLDIAPAETAAVQTAAPAGAGAPIAIKSAILQSDLRARTPINQDFKTVDGGVANDNKSMSHFISNQYMEGSLHKLPHGFQESVRWTPSAAEILQGHDVASVIGNAAPVRASLEPSGMHNQVVYRSTYPDTDERMYIRPEGGIEHDIVLRQLPRSVDAVRDLAYSGYLDLGQGLSLWDGARQITSGYRTRNGIEIRNRQGNPVFFLRPPVAWDASVSQDDGSLNKVKQAKNEYIQSLTACEYKVDFNESGVKLAVVTPGKWLANPGRAFPVVIDPNLGPFGLADGSPPRYIAAQGSDTIIPANAGGTKINYMNATSVGVQPVPLPFPFTFYGTAFNTVNVHIDGYADFGNAVPDSPFNAALPVAGYNLSMFVYWSGLQFSNDPETGVFYFSDGTAPNRRFIIEWNKMTFRPGTVQNLNNNNFNPFNPFGNNNNPTNPNQQPNPNSPPPSNGGSTQQLISMNLVLFECDSKFEYIIGQQNEKDLGFATVGEQGILDNTLVPPTVRYIQFDFDSALGQGVVDPTTGQVTPNPPITPGTSLTFSLSTLSSLAVTPASAIGCIPKDVCFNATVTPPISTCATTTTVPTVGFHWVFGDGSEAFTSSVCHTFTKAGTYAVTLTVTDQLGIRTVAPVIPVLACDVPHIVVDVEPQGGVAPLEINMSAVIGFSSTLTLVGPPIWYVDLLNVNGPLGNTIRAATISGNPVSVRLDTPGVYKVTVIQNGVDSLSGQPTSQAGYAFVYVANPNAVITDPLIITTSQFTIDWVSKQPRQDTDGGFPVLPPDNPNHDFMNVNGILPLPGVVSSQLLGKEITVTLNGTQTIFDGVLDASGHAMFGTAALPPGPSGEFQIELPSGNFSMAVQGDLYKSLGLFNGTEKRLIAAEFTIAIQDIYPRPGDPGNAFITYDYHSNGYTVGPPPTGSAEGVFDFGDHTKDKVLAGFTGIKQIKSGQRRPGGRTLLISGAFVVKNARFSLQGNTVFASLTGMLGRYGGDSLRPTVDSDVVVSLGGYSDILNFTTTPTFKATGKSPKQKFSFKRASSLGATGVASLNWANQPGTFGVTTFAIPNDGPLGVGINPALGVQTLSFGLVITPESGEVFRALAHFDIVKTSPTTFSFGSGKK